MKIITAILPCGICLFLFLEIGIKTYTPYPSSDLELSYVNKALYLDKVENPENIIAPLQNDKIHYHHNEYIYSR